MTDIDLDKARLRDALDRYIWSIDTHEVTPFVENFTDDAVYETPFGTATGATEIAAAIDQWHSSGITKGKRHFGGPAHIEINGDRATVASTYFILEVEGAPGVVASGAYEDEWRRSGSTWLIARRRQTIDPSYRPAGS